MEYWLKFLAVAAASALASASTSAVSASTVNDWVNCGGAGITPDVQLAACTAVIKSSAADRRALVAAFTDRGLAWRAKGDYDKAIADFDQAIALQPNVLEAYAARGATRGDEGDYPQAMVDLNHALQLKPASHRNDWDLWSFDKRDRGHFASLFAANKEAATHFPAYATALNARCWVETVSGGDLEQALSDCENGIILAPNDLEILENRGLTRLKRTDFAKAVADEAAVLAKEPNQALALFVKGLAEQRLGQQSEGAADIAAANTIDPQLLVRFAKLGMVPK